MALPPSRSLAISCLAAAAILVSACGPRYPLGITEDRWSKMSVAEQDQARMKQAEVDRARAEARRQEAEAREAEATARAAALDHARANAAPGERVQCILQPVEMSYGGEWRAAEPLGLDLVAGLPIAFTLHDREGRYRSRDGTAHFNGMEIRLCQEGRKNDCGRFLATSGELRRGKTQPVQAEDFLRGRMHCELAATGGRFYPERHLRP